MSWLLQHSSNAMSGPVCLRRLQLFHSYSTTSYSPRRRRARRDPTPVGPQFERDEVPHSDTAASPAPAPKPLTTKNLILNDKHHKGTRRWNREISRSDGAKNDQHSESDRARWDSGRRSSFERSTTRRPSRTTNWQATRPPSEGNRDEHRRDPNHDSPPSGYSGRGRYYKNLAEARAELEDKEGIPNNIGHTEKVPSTHLQRIPESAVPEAAFTSPPLMPGLLSCLHDVLGPKAKPTPIQALSIQHFLATHRDDKKYQQYLLASETGSGKSIAYLLPLLQSLKHSELDGSINRQHTHPLNPRALILAPTHELARQLATFAKSLIHDIKLRVQCASRANVNNKMDPVGGTPRQMKEKLDALFGGKDFDVRAEGRFPVDLVVGTPMKLLEMVKGRGWDRRLDEEKEDETPLKEPADQDEVKPKFRKGRDVTPTIGRTGKTAAELGLTNVDWVIVDEADVLFDPDFQETTRLLLSEIASERGSPVPYYPDTFNYTPTNTAVEPKPVDYPFHLLLTSATIPSALSTYLNIHHPSHTRLTSPKLHHLPTTLQTEYVGWTGGNKLADIEKRLRRVWSEDSITRTRELSKVLVFCNKNTKVQMLSKHLEEKGIKNIAIDGSPESRAKGSNRHLDGFLRKPLAQTTKIVSVPKVEDNAQADLAQTPHVLITTSLLSRGIDFSPQIKHVFIVDEPRNMVDFLHRAGRSGRAGQIGKVVVFGKLEGRGSGRAKDVRMRVGRLR